MEVNTLRAENRSSIVQEAAGLPAELTWQLHGGDTSVATDLRLASVLVGLDQASNASQLLAKIMLKHNAVILGA